MLIENKQTKKDRTLVRLTSRQAGGAIPWELSGLQSYNQRTNGKEEKELLCLSLLKIFIYLFGCAGS